MDSGQFFPAIFEVQYYGCPGWFFRWTIEVSGTFADALIFSQRDVRVFLDLLEIFIDFFPIRSEDDNQATNYETNINHKEINNPINHSATNNKANHKNNHSWAWNFKWLFHNDQWWKLYRFYEFNWIQSFRIWSILRLGIFLRFLLQLW